jgi:hypothetical protein
VETVGENVPEAVPVEETRGGEGPGDWKIAFQDWREEFQKWKKTHGTSEDSSE